MCDALWADLHKCYEEAYMTEIGLVYAEIREAVRNRPGVRGNPRSRPQDGPLGPPAKRAHSHDLPPF